MAENEYGRNELQGMIEFPTAAVNSKVLFLKKKKNQKIVSITTYLRPLEPTRSDASLITISRHPPAQFSRSYQPQAAKNRTVLMTGAMMARRKDVSVAG
jgi:hypothetical protein